MSPAQQRALAVALDGLREAFGDDLREAAVEVMRKAEPNHDNLLATRVAVVVRERLVGIAAERAGEAGESVAMQAFGWLTDLYMELGRLDLTPIIESCAGKFSPPEAGAGASTHRPTEETEQRGGLTVRRGAPVCSHCRDTAARVDCRACGGSGLANLDDVRPDVV